MTRLNFSKRYRNFGLENSRSEATRWGVPDAPTAQSLPIPTVAEIWAETELMGRRLIKLRGEAAAAKRESLTIKGSYSRTLTRAAEIKRASAKKLVPVIMLSLGRLRGRGLSVVEIKNRLNEINPEFAVILHKQDAWRDFW